LLYERLQLFIYITPYFFSDSTPNLLAMKETILIGLIVFFIQSQVISQIRLQFSVTQLPELKVNAGKDTTVAKGSQVRIGGINPATGGSGLFSYSWTPTSGLDKIDVPNPTATVSTDITYTLTVSDGSSCAKSSSINLKVSTVTAIDPVAIEVGLKIFPNPVNRNFFITTETILLDRTLTIEIFDLTGKKIFFSSLKGNRKLNESINLPGSSSGVYILKLTGTKMNANYKLVVL
jgi:hypothetical protein